MEKARAELEAKEAVIKEQTQKDQKAFTPNYPSNPYEPVTPMPDFPQMNPISNQPAEEENPDTEKAMVFVHM